MNPSAAFSAYQQTEKQSPITELYILDTPPELEYDAMVKMAADIFTAPFAALNLFDKDRLWVKSQFGLNTGEMPIKDSICQQVLESKKGVTVENIQQNDGINKLPLVSAELINFYTGQPLVLSSGDVVGTICVMDKKTREKPSDKEIESLGVPFPAACGVK